MLSLIEIIVGIIVLLILIGPMVILWRLEPLTWDDPSGIPIPNEVTREEIAEELNVDPADLLFEGDFDADDH